jgi:small subunit ribosomal protein S16
MTVRIRLNKTGTRKKIKHRVVVTDSRSPRDGRFIEILGYWNPSTEPETLQINSEKAQDWVNKGAKPSNTVRSLLKRSGVTITTKK